MTPQKDTSLIVAKAKSIREAQDNKDLKIAFFNSTNNAIEMVKINENIKSEAQQKESIVMWREWFLNEHTEHHKRMVNQTSATVPVGEAVTRLRATINLVDLKAVWASLTQDERNQADILAEAQAQRKKYVTPKA